MSETFAEEVLRRRLELGLTQEQLGTASNLCRQTIRAVERGSDVSALTLRSVLRALDDKDAVRKLADVSATEDIALLRSQLAEERAAHQQTQATLRAIHALLDANGGNR